MVLQRAELFDSVTASSHIESWPPSAVTRHADRQNIIPPEVLRPERFVLETTRQPFKPNAERLSCQAHVAAASAAHERGLAAMVPSLGG